MYITDLILLSFDSKLASLSFQSCLSMNKHVLCLCAWAKLVYIYVVFLLMLTNHCFHSISLFRTLNTCSSMYFLIRQCLIFFCSSLHVLMFGFGPFLLLVYTVCTCCLQTLKSFIFFINLLPKSWLFPFQRSSVLLLALYRYIFRSMYCLFYINVTFPYHYLYLQVVIWVPSLYDGLAHTLLFPFYPYLHKIICLYST